MTPETQKHFNYPEVQLTYRRKSDFGPQLINADDTYRFLMDVWDQDTIDLIPESYMLLLDAECRLAGVSHLSKGPGVYDKKTILLTAMKANAPNIVLAHNDPSGYAEPGDNAIKQAQELKENCKMFDIELRDMLIVCRAGFYSFNDDGMLWMG